MKNNEKRQFSAKKILFGVLVIMVGFFTFNNSYAVTTDSCSTLTINECTGSIDNDGNDCVWDSDQQACFGSNMIVECSQKQTWAGCFLKKGCVWYDTANAPKCKPRSSKYLAKSNWKKDDCNMIWNKEAYKNDNNEWVGGYKIKPEDENGPVWVDGDYKYFKKLSEYVVLKDGESIIYDGPFAASSACNAVVSQNENVCDYTYWLNNSGKRKCRKYLKLKEKAKHEKCVEEIENIWQRSLKTSEDREIRQNGLQVCEESSSYMSYVDTEYDGPVFDGPGLRGGAQMAQMELSNSISKQRDIKKLLISWSKFALEIAAVIAVLALIYAGFRYITDMGDGGGVEAAKKIIIWVVVGLLLILSAYAIVNTVIKARFGADGARASITINKIIT